MSQSGYSMSDLARESQTRWLKPAEVYFILQNYDDHMITHQPVQKPASGSLFLFNRRVFRNFRKDGHTWRRKKDGRSGEAHEKLKVGNVEALNCYYAHGEQNPLFQRRSYWMLDPGFEHIVLVLYRDVNEVSGRNNVVRISQFTLVPSSTFNQSPSSYASLQAGSSAAYERSSSFGSVEISYDPAPNTTNQINYFGYVEATKELRRSLGPEISEALQRLEKLLSLDDDSSKEFDPFYAAHADGDDLYNIISSQAISSPVLGVDCRFISLRHIRKCVGMYVWWRRRSCPGVIQEGVISCNAPPHLHGNVTICITSGNRESCSEISHFEYCDKLNG